MKKALSIKIVILLTTLMLLILLLNSCVPRGIKVNPPECPELPQGCLPQVWTGSSYYDTLQNNARQYYYRIDEVSGINSPEDEWQISYDSPNSGIFTFSESGLHKAMLVRKINVSEFSIEKGISGLQEAHNGAFSIQNSSAAYTSSPAVSSEIAKTHGNYFLTPIGNVIGKSRIITAKYSNGNLTHSIEYKDNSLDELDWSGQPALNTDGSIMIFASDRKNGEGGTDLWICRKDANGEFSQPINLGNSINSRCDEISPFISPNGKRLYFSSAGHSTVGGYDLFYSEINQKLWNEIGSKNSESDLSSYFSKPVNLGTPVNTTYDELFPSCSGDCDEALYYSSNQNQTSALVGTRGGFDMFVVHKILKHKAEKDIVKEDKPIEINKEEAKPKQNLNDVVLKGTVYEKNTNKPIVAAEVSIKKDLDSKNLLTDNSGKFEFPLNRNAQYEVTAQKKEFFFDSKRIFLSPDFPQDTVDMDFYLPEIGVIRINFPTDEYMNPYKYTLDSNGIETGRLWTEELKLVASNIKMALDRIDRIVLVGHTDDVGTDAYNMALGLRRVDFVMNELVKLGIPREVLYSRTAGEGEPIPKNKDEDTTTYRKRLRRVTMEKFFK